MSFIDGKCIRASQALLANCFIYPKLFLYLISILLKSILQSYFFTDLFYLLVHYIIQHWQETIFIPFFDHFNFPCVHVKPLPSSFLSVHYTFAISTFLTYFCNLFGLVEKIWIVDGLRNRATWASCMCVTSRPRCPLYCSHLWATRDCNYILGKV